MTPISDGTPNSALEAMSARCPLIMPNLPYDKSIFEDCCFVLNNDDPKELAARNRGRSAIVS
jgi:glycosyltransferase involved in cell wall biosynthesis